MKQNNLLKQLYALLVILIPLGHTAYSQCTNPAPGQVAVEIEVTTGSNYGVEISWILEDSTGTSIASVPTGTYPTNPGNTAYGGTHNANQQLCLDTNMTYTFKAYDSFGDSWNGGTYEIRNECLGTIYANNGGAVPNNGVSTGGSSDLESTESFNVFSVNLFDIGVTAITAPVNPLTSGNQPVEVSISNYGTDTAFTYIVGWSVNGVIQPPFSSSVAIPSCGGSANVTIGNYTFANAPTNICAWTINASDLVTNNDTACQSLCPGMSGTYTVDAGSPASVSNYQSFGDLLSDFSNCGIAAPVVVNVVAGSGPYTEQIILNNYSGLSATNTLIINGNGNEVNYSASSSDKRIVGFDGAKHITIDSLTIRSTSSTYGYGVHLMNGSDSVSIVKCTIDLSSITSTSSTNSGGIIASGSITSTTTDGNNSNFSLFANNIITGSASGGPYVGIYLNGQGTGADCRGNTVMNNVISDFRSYGIYLDEVDSASINGNEISRANRTSVTTFYGIYTGGKTQKTQYTKNKIFNNSGGNTSSTSTAYGIYHTSDDADVGNENLVVNNVIYGFNSNGTVYGLYNSSSNGVWYYHNTIVLDDQNSSSSTARGFYQTTTASNIQFKNNVVSVTRNSSADLHALYFNASGSTIDCNYNRLHVENGYTGRYSSVNYTSLIDWQGANSNAYDQNSTGGNPGFTDPLMGDLTPSSLSLNNSGTNLSIATDINNASRGATPDPGAVEFSPPNNDVVVVSIDSIKSVGRANSNSAFTSTEMVAATVINNGLNTQSNIPITFTVGSQTVNETIAGPLASGATLAYIFTGTANLQVAGSYTLEVYTSLGTDENTSNDTNSMHIRSLDNSPTNLPFIEDFEAALDTTYQTDYMGLEGITMWDFQTLTQGSGRLQTSTGNSQSGTKALSLDRSTGGTVVNHLMQMVNMTNYSTTDSIMLSFSYRDHGEENHANDSVWVRGSENDPWIGIYDLWANKVTNNWKHVDPINVSSVLTANSQSFSTTTQVRFGQEDNSTLGGDGFTFEDVQWNIVSPFDVGIVSIDSLSNSCGLGSTNLIGVTIKNHSFLTLNSGTSIDIFVNGGVSNITETVTLASNLAGGAEVGLVLTNTIDLSNTQTYDLLGYTVLVGDTFNNLNDSNMFSVTNIPIVSSYPYFEKFDQGSAGWISGGTNSSWELTTPANAVINSAASGANSWVTNSTGNYNPSENSQVVSPCFDFTSPPTNPHVAMKLWYESEFSWDGLVMQLSTDDGATWNNVGAQGDNYNWYNDGTLNGNPGGQGTGWTGRNGSGSNGWINVAHSLDTSVINNQSSVKFRLAFGADGSVHDEGVAFDNFAVGTPMDIFLGNDTSVCDGYVLDPNLPSNGDFLWSTGDTSSTLELAYSSGGIDSQTISLIYFDSLGLPATDTITVGVFSPVVPSLSSPLPSGSDNITCFGGNDGSIVNASTGGMGTVTYSWTGPNSFTSSVASPTGLFAGMYYMSTSDSIGCMVMDSINITEAMEIVATTTIDSVISCNSATDAGVSVSSVGGTGPHTYLWSTGSTMAYLSGIGSGTYMVTVTDSLSCIDTISITLSDPQIIATTVSVDSNVSCNGFSDAGLTSNTTGGTTPYTYLWSNAATNMSNTGIAAGTYTVTVSDANGCTASGTNSVTEPTTSIATITIDSNASCNGFANGGATASATGGTMPYTYAWSNAATTASITSVPAGIYNITVTDANGCTATTTGTISEATSLVTNFYFTAINCNGETSSTSIVSNGGTAPYTVYDSSNTVIASNVQPGDSTNGVTLAGSQIFTITDANGCSNYINTSITEPGLLVSATTIDSNISCNNLSNGGATASATGGTMPYTYAWSNAATTASITGVIAGTYSVTITDANGCTDSTSATITEPAILDASISLDSNVSCNAASDGGATASATGGTMPYTYAWSNTATTASITGVGPGTYTITITDANGCSDTSSVMITEPAVLAMVSVVDSNLSCNGNFTGGASASASGGTMPYAYAWSNFANTASITGVQAGNYGITITDANGCTDTSSVTITEPTSLTSSAVVDSNITCNGLADGGATGSASGGTTPYAYLWSNGATTASITGVVAGSYILTVTDANGCVSFSSASITEPNTLSVSAMIDSNETCLNTMDGGASVSVSGGTTPYVYLWNNGASTSSITGLTAGTFSVTVTDANGCSNSSSVTITHGLATSHSYALTTCDSYTSPSGNYTWTTSGTYNDTILNAVGCDSTLTINLTILNSTSLTRNITACDGYLSLNGIFTYTLSGTYVETIPNAVGCDSVVTTHLTIIHSTDSTVMITACDEYTSPSGNHTWNTAGTYSDVIPNSVGCDSNLTIVLAIINSTTFDQTVTICKGESVDVGSSAYTVAGTYVDTLVNSIGCDSVVTTELIVDEVDVNLSIAGFTLTADNSNGTYQWIYCDSNNAAIPGATDQSYTTVVSGNYAVVITENNCTDTSACTLVDGVGIIDISRDIAVKVFPNPAGADLSSVTIEVSNLTDYQIVIRDLTGKIVFNKDHLNLKSNTIDISGFAAGSFFIEVKTDNNSTFSKLIVL